MNRESKNLGYVLNFSSILMFIAILGMIFTYSNITIEVQCLILIIFSFIQFLLSFIITHNLKLDVSGKWFYGIGFISLLMSFILFSNSNYIIDLFKQNGFIYVYLSMISLIIGIFFIITSIIYKNNKLIKVTYLCGFIIVCLLLKYYNVNLFYIILIISLISLVINIFYYKKNIYSISKIFVYIIPCISIFMENISISNMLLFTVINTINIFIILYRNKDIESVLLSLLVISISYFVLDYKLFDLFTLNYSIPIIISIHLLTLLVLEYSKLIDKKILFSIYKICIYSFIVIIIAYTIKEKNVVCLIASSLLLITLVANRLIFKDKKLNHYCLPIGILIEMISILCFININYLNINTSICLFILNIVLLILYKFNKDYNLKIIYSILICLILLDLVFMNNLSIFNYLINLGVLLIDYVYVTVLDEKKNGIIDYIFYVILLSFSLIQLNYLDINHVKYLIISFLYLILLYKNKDNKFKLGITLISLAISLILYIRGVTSIYWISEILSSTIILLLSIIYSYLIIDNENEQMIFITILLDLVILYLLPNRLTLFISLYILFISILMIIYAIKNEKYKFMLISGIIFIFISISSLLTNLATIPLFLYLFLISLIIMIILIYLIKNQNNISYNICPNCKKKIDKTDKYCGNCGKQIK